jgi:hypothetical protein
MTTREIIAVDVLRNTDAMRAIWYAHVLAERGEWRPIKSDATANLPILKPQ